MKIEIIDSIPNGLTKSKKQGWLKPAVTPESKAIKKLKEDKDRLEQELAELKATVSELVSKKKR